MQNKRLLICDEMSSDQTIDVSLVKDITSGTDSTRQGRKFGSSEIFNFPWEAGIILSFNEGCVPKIGGTTDDPKAFWKRAIAIPMVSRFEDKVPEDAEPYTYKANRDIDSNFRDWRSAFLKILIDHWDPDLVNSATAGDQTWVTDLASQHNPLKQWLDSSLKITKNKKDWISREDVVSKYMESDQYEGMKKKDVQISVENYLKAASINYKTSGGKISGRYVGHLARGIAFH